MQTLAKRMILIGCLVLPVAAADWPQWRGPQRTGISAETGLLKAWPEQGPRLVWKVQGLGEGFSSFSISQGRLFTQGQRGSQQFVIALDSATGKTLWEVAHGKDFRERRGHGPRGTPTVDSDRLYALAADGTLSCLETATGKTVWSMNLLEKFGARNLNWGISESPLIDGDLIFVNPGGSEASIVALHKRTGNVVWKSQSDEAGYSSSIMVNVGGIKHIITFTGEGVVGLRANNGELLWRYSRVSNSTANIATPIYRDGYVFLSSDYGTGCALLKLTAEGGGIKATEVYFSREMKNHYSSSVLVGDYLYGFSSSILTCMKYQTGDVVWRDRSVGKGSLVYADGHLYCLSENGVVGLVEANSEGYKEKSRFEIPRGSFPTWSQPVVANGKLYLREQDTLYCYDVKGS